MLHSLRSRLAGNRWTMVGALALSVALFAGCDDSDDSDEGAGGSAAPDSGTGGGEAGGGTGGGDPVGGAGGGDPVGGAGGAAVDPCRTAVDFLLDCGIDQGACVGWTGEGASTREEIDAGLMEGCAGTPALAAIVNGAADCSVIDTVKNLNPDFAASCDGTGADLELDTADKINAYLEGKTLTMEGDNIPTHPNGFDENANFGQATQCYHSTVMEVLGGTFKVTSQLGTLNDAPTEGDVGTCDRTTVAGELMFDSTLHVVENITGNAECFDFTVTYAGFGQEGRGMISPDGSEIHLELFFTDQAVGHRCADGAVGAPDTITLNGAAFAGDAVQRYMISATE